MGDSPARDRKAPAAPRKKRGKPRKQTPSWSLYPTRHDAVSDLLEEDALFFDFHHNDSDTDKDCEKSYDTFIKGRFTCTNTNCKSSGWSSLKIPITIRMYRGAEYNARVYYQRCKVCKQASEPILDHSYAERVAYRLKFWCGVPVERPPRSGQSKAPHRSDLCEGCRLGHCRGLLSKS